MTLISFLGSVALCAPRTEWAAAFADRAAFLTKEQRRGIRQHLSNFRFQLTHVYGEGQVQTRLLELLDSAMGDMEVACQNAYELQTKVC